MAKVFVLGSLNVDTSYYLEKLPERGMTVSANSSRKAAGGKGMNQAAAVSFTGCGVNLIGAVGDDEDGRMISGVLKEYPIDTEYLARVGQPTGTAIIYVGADAGNMIVVHGGANRCVPVYDIMFEQGDWLMAQLETETATVQRYFEMAKEKGAYTMLNLSPYQPLDKCILEMTDLLIVNEHEASQLIHKPIRCAAQAVGIGIGSMLKETGINRAVITLGSEGAVVLENGAGYHIQGKNAAAVDTQGAGDAFAGVLAGMLAQGASLQEAAEYANSVAAECVEVRGSTLISLKALKHNLY